MYLQSASLHLDLHRARSILLGFLVEAFIAGNICSAVSLTSGHQIVLNHPCCLYLCSSSVLVRNRTLRNDIVSLSGRPSQNDNNMPKLIDINTQGFIVPAFVAASRILLGMHLL